MSFVFLKFAHVALMFLGSALAVGPASILYLLSRSGDVQTIRTSFRSAERLFQLSTACYGLGVLAGLAAAFAGTLDLTASWLLTAYVLVALLGGHGILFERWTKQVVAGLAASTTRDATLARLQREGLPLYLVSAMAVLVVAIVFVMVTKLAF